MLPLIAQASIQILKPIDQVFEAVVNPEIITRYFISSSSGRMETGKELIWEFADFPRAFPVQVLQVNPPHFLEFVWDPETRVRIHLKKQAHDRTVVEIEEGEKPLNQQNLEWLVGNTFGWGNFLDCLKAYLEYGINLRKGAFDYRNNP